MGTWTPGTRLHARLAALWDEGLSCSAIAERLGYTKNAVVGAAHRLELPARPSPIGFGSKPWSSVKARSKRLAAAGHSHERALPAGAGGLPSLASVVAATVPPRRRSHEMLAAAAQQRQAARATPAQKPASRIARAVDKMSGPGGALTPAPALTTTWTQPMPEAPAEPSTPPPPRVYQPPVAVHACCWPIGTPREAGFHFCGAPRARIDRPYCDAHCAVAYIRVRDRREDAAA